MKHEGCAGLNCWCTLATSVWHMHEGWIPEEYRQWAIRQHTKLDLNGDIKHSTGVNYEEKE